MGRLLRWGNCLPTTSHYIINWSISVAIPLVSTPRYVRFLAGIQGLLLCGLHGCPYPWSPNLWDVGVLTTHHLRDTPAWGNGWLEYDRTFWHQATVDWSLPWHSLVPGLQVATILSIRPSGGLFCIICREPDHSASQCARLVVQPPSYSRVGGQSPRAWVITCHSWNQGQCAFLHSCSYRHVCSLCWRDHRAVC